MKFDNLYGDVPKEMHDKLQSTLMGLPAAEEKGKNTGIKAKRFSPKRLAMILAAVVMCITMMVTAFAYGDEVLAAIFKRKKELIEDKQAFINETVSVGEISLSADTVTIQRSLAEDLFLDIEVSIHNKKGVFENGLDCRAAKIEMLVKDGMKLYDSNRKKYQAGEWYTIYAFDKDNDNSDSNPNVLNIERGLHDIGYGLEDKTDTLKLSYDVVGSYTDYRITYYDLTSYDGSVKYADEISVSFSLEEKDASPIQQLDMYESGIEFELEGFIYQLEEIDMTPNQLTVKIRNKDMDTFEIDGKEYLAINLVSSFSCQPGLVEALEGMERLREEYNGRSEEMYDSNEYSALMSKLATSGAPTSEQSLLDRCYELAADLKPECGAEITSSEHSGMSADSLTHISAKARLKFSSPIYVQDIERLYLRKIGDPSVEVTIWEPSKDGDLSEFINKAK